MKDEKPNVVATILAGGSGSRLWPLSRQYLPKQFPVLNGTATLLQTTIARYLARFAEQFLDAVAMGCNLVITEKGDIRDYFGDDAFYCEPDSVESIREAIVNAYNAPPSTTLARRIRGDFNWQKTAERTLEGYQIALG